MPTITFRGENTSVGGGLFLAKYTCTDNRTFGRCKIRLVDGSFFPTTTGSYTGMYRLDSPDGQLKNPLACSNYGGILINPYDAGATMRNMLQNDKSFEFKVELTSSILYLTLTPAIYAPNTPLANGVINFDSSFLVFDVEPI